MDEMKEKIQTLFYGGYCDDMQTKETIREVWEKYEYLIDTHTAVACKVYQDYVAQTGDTTKTVIASTANPFKFSGSVLEALGQPLDGNEFELLERLSDYTGQKIPISLAELRTKEVRFSSTCKKEEMPEIVAGFLN